MNQQNGKRRLATEWWLVALLSSALALFLVHDRATQRLDTLLYDLLLQFDRSDPDPRILIVGIDDHGMREAGAWPWPRDLQAALIDRLAEADPAAIAYDVLLLDSKPGDAELGRAIAGPAKVFVPLLMRAPGTNGAPFDIVLPVPEVGQAADGIGHVNLLVDPDGKVRRVRLLAGDERGRWPHLMALMHDAADPSVPLEGRAGEPLLIPFAGSAGHFPTIGASSVLRGEVPAELLRNRLILVGATAEGLGDRYATGGGNPGGVLPGIEIQAHLLNGLLSDKMIEEAGFWPHAALALLPLWFLLFALRVLQPSAIFVLIAGLVILLLATAAVALLALRFWVTPVPGLAALAIVYPLWGWRRLAAANSYMIGELERFRAEPDVLAPASPLPSAPDPVARQMALLADAIGQSRDLRHFVTESLRQLPDGLFVADRKGKVILANTEAEALVEELQLPCAEQTLPALYARLQPIPAAEGRPGGGESELPPWPPSEGTGRYRARLASGRCFEIRVGPRRSAQGELLGWIVRTTDITTLWETQRQREDMLQFLSHDMRSPQASILALLDKAEGHGIDPAIAERIEGHARRTIALAEGFVQLARAESLPYEPEPVNAADMLVDALDQLWPRIAAKDLKVALTGEDACLFVAGERSLLTRAVVNLIDNAVYHSSPGGRLDCSIDLREEQGGRTVICRIADEGPGIPPDHLAALFERFRQAPGKGRGDGVGLGLAQVHTVAGRHGGWVRCESQPGRGATFLLGLPLLSELSSDP
ncbi:CHASE2 domain-containing protein [Pelagerythrobacter rhizovicinus]|uniref:histidine kinase n=1 Tax=Pelagerythrobacter rhizovicinus TaxID=2268576 RepID=A0A4V1QWF5_9SPHN|nr:CHASE2 domain-containing protein [Pelagerythrobacter rhizovicinus]RXZ65976.1 CHASE2 domain-containing protein [Pelagerythrobacter rhizovicinus]